jgi:hypothetical protein
VEGRALTQAAVGSVRSVVLWRSCAFPRGLQRAQSDALGKLNLEAVVHERASISERHSDYRLLCHPATRRAAPFRPQRGAWACSRRRRGRAALRGCARRRSRPRPPQIRAFSRWPPHHHGRVHGCKRDPDIGCVRGDSTQAKGARKSAPHIAPFSSTAPASMIALPPSRSVYRQKVASVPPSASPIAMPSPCSSAVAATKPAPKSWRRRAPLR